MGAWTTGLAPDCTVPEQEEAGPALHGVEDGVVWVWQEEVDWGVSLESLQWESPSTWREVGVGLGLAAREADRPGLCPALSPALGQAQEGDLMTLLSFLICTMGG